MRAQAEAAIRQGLKAVDHAVEHRWRRALERADAIDADTHEAAVGALKAGFAKELAATGAMAGGTAAVPGLGTMAAASTSASEFGWFTLRATDLILSIAALHGHRDHSVEERRMWVLSILAFGDDAADGLAEVGKLTKGLSVQAIRRVPLESAKSINRRLVQRVVAKYAHGRARLAAGRLLPFGVGAAVGAAGNYLAVHALARQADAFFADLSS